MFSVTGRGGFSPNRGGRGGFSPGGGTWPGPWILPEQVLYQSTEFVNKIISRKKCSKNLVKAAVDVKSLRLLNHKRINSIFAKLG